MLDGTPLAYHCFELAFARTLPTMIFDTRCEVRDDPDAPKRAALVGQASA